MCAEVEFGCRRPLWEKNPSSMVPGSDSSLLFFISIIRRRAAVCYSRLGVKGRADRSDACCGDLTWLELLLPFQQNKNI